jgi:hypothetical protein
MRRLQSTLLALAVLATLASARSGSAQERQYPLEATDGVRLHNVAAQPATLTGKKGLRVTLSEEGAAQLQRMTPEQRAQGDIEQLVVIEGRTSRAAPSRRRSRGIWPRGRLGPRVDSSASPSGCRRT